MDDCENYEDFMKSLARSVQIVNGLPLDLKFYETTHAKTIGHDVRALKNQLKSYISKMLSFCNDQTFTIDSMDDLTDYYDSFIVDTVDSMLEQVVRISFFLMIFHWSSP